VFVHFEPALRIELDRSIHYYVKRRFSEGFHLHEPLVGEIRLDDSLTPIASADTVHMVFGLDK
jgi:hypothetical protein